jgi:hypothetical protein
MSQVQKQASIDKFENWSDFESRPIEYYLSFVNLKNQTLKKDTVRKTAGLGDKVLKKGGNPDVQRLFFAFEKVIVKKLQDAGLLPLPVSETSSEKKIATGNKSSNPSPKAFEQEARNNAFNANRVAQLEKENLDLKNRIKQLEGRLSSAQKVNERNRETIEVMNEVNAVL